MGTSEPYIDIVFDGPPGPVCGRFVEVEGASGKSMAIGEWVCRPDGYWALRMRPSQMFAFLESALERRLRALEKPHAPRP